MRLSGSHALDIASALFHHKHPEKRNHSDSIANGFASHRVYLGHLIHPRNQNVLDEILMVAMHAPNSYTREHVVEFQCHGGELVLKKVLEAVLTQGARIAEPGEFTKRAFLNGRIDLSQAEAVAELINAGNDLSLTNALKNLDGKIKLSIDRLIERLTSTLALLEASIEFPDEIEDTVNRTTMLTELRETVLLPIIKIVGDSQKGQPYLHGFYMDIIGRPNVGKSSLLNKLLGKERAIVTAVPGTTRDLVEGQTSLKGIPIHITDTAGIHLTDDPVESIGIEKAKAHVSDSDLILFVIEATDTDNFQDLHVFDLIKEKATIVVLNKIDLLPNGDKPSIPEYLKDKTVVAASALSGQGIHDLTEKISDHFRQRSPFEDENLIMANLRQTEALSRAAQAVERAIVSLENSLGEEIIVVDIHDTITQLKYVTGEIGELDIMDRIFDRFCIGK